MHPRSAVTEAGVRPVAVAIPDRPLTRVRSICLALPEATERESHGSPGFFVAKQFVMLWHRGHHDHDFPHLWCAAPAGEQQALVAERPDRFFVPPYVGHRGWLDELAKQLCLIYDGAVIGSWMDRDPSAGATARTVAAALVDAAID